MSRPTFAEDPADRLIREAVQADMERVYGVERRETPREPATPRKLESIFLRRQAE